MTKHSWRNTSKHNLSTVQFQIQKQVRKYFKSIVVWDKVHQADQIGKRIKSSHDKNCYKMFIICLQSVVSHRWKDENPLPIYDVFKIKFKM